MFQSTSAWFSSSVDRKYIDLWIKQGGIVVDTYKADKLPEYLFSCDLEEHDTQRTIKHISYMVFHPDWIIDSITENEQKPTGQYELENYFFHDSKVNKIADNNKSNNKINSNGSTDILADLADHNQTDEDYIVAHSLTIPNQKYYLPLKRARKVSRGKNPVQGNDERQSTITDLMNDDPSQDLQIIDMQIDSEAEGNCRSTINIFNEDISGDPKRNKRDRPRTLPDFMSKKRPKVVLTSTSEDDSFFSDEEDSNQKRNRTNYTQKSIRTSSVGKKSPSLRCECGRSIQSTTPAKKLLVKRLKDPPQSVSKSIASIRLQHISIRSLLDKVLKYLQVVKGPNSALMDDVYEFTPGQNGFSAQLKSTAVTSTNPRIQTRGKSSSRKT